MEDLAAWTPVLALAGGFVLALSGFAAAALQRRSARDANKTAARTEDREAAESTIAMWRDMAIERAEEAKTWKTLYKEAIALAQSKASEVRAADGLAPLEPVADVRPLHNSPVTPAQRSAAEIATAQAEIAAAALAINHGVEPEHPPLEYAPDAASTALPPPPPTPESVLKDLKQVLNSADDAAPPTPTHT